MDHEAQWRVTLPVARRPGRARTIGRACGSEPSAGPPGDGLLDSQRYSSPPVIIHLAQWYRREVRPERVVQRVDVRVVDLDAACGEVAGIPRPWRGGVD